MISKSDFTVFVNEEVTMSLFKPCAKCGRAILPGNTNLPSREYPGGLCYDCYEKQNSVINKIGKVVGDSAEIAVKSFASETGRLLVHKIIK